MIKQGGEICLLFMFSSQWLEAIYSRNPEKDGNGCVYCALLALPWLISSPPPPPAQGFAPFLETQNILPTMKAFTF